MPKAPPRCVRCREYFDSNHPLQKYCRPECRNQAYVERRRRQIKAAREASYDLHHHKNCLICDKRFRPIRRDAEYCSAKCRMRAWRGSIQLDG
jgi:hypothetical protein